MKAISLTEIPNRRVDAVHPALQEAVREFATDTIEAAEITTEVKAQAKHRSYTFSDGVAVARRLVMYQNVRVVQRRDRAFLVR